jgi:DNA invertase Pin-like site-specific DNA recombinase
MMHHNNRTYAGAVHYAVPVLGYVRATKDETATVLRAQAAAIRHALLASRGPHGFKLIRMLREDQSHEEGGHRLREALDMLEVGKARVLVVTRWDRLAVVQGAVQGVINHSKLYGWSLEVLDGLQGSAPMSTGGEFRSGRTIEGLAAARAIGVRLGRPRVCSDDVLARAVRLRAAGWRLVDIAEQFNSDALLTPGGGARWYASHVSRLLKTQDARQLFGSTGQPEVGDDGGTPPLADAASARPRNAQRGGRSRWLLSGGRKARRVGPHWMTWRAAHLSRPLVT